MADLKDSGINPLGLGCSNFGKRCDAPTGRRIVRAAVDAGINFFDVADVYGGGTAESILADGLQGLRDEVFVATKFGHDTKGQGDARHRGGHPDNVMASAEASLRALNTDYIDLFQLHQPDPEIPIADTMGALSELVDAGKVRWIGCSNFSISELEEARLGALHHVTPGFQSLQNEYSLVVRQPEKDVLPFCRDHELAFIPYFPLASGVLTGKYRQDQRVPNGSRVAAMKPDKLWRFFTPEALGLVQVLADYGEENGYTVLELALGFLLAEETVLSVISGAMSEEQVRENTAAATRAGNLSQDDISFLRSLSVESDKPSRAN